LLATLGAKHAAELDKVKLEAVEREKGLHLELETVRAEITSGAFVKVIFFFSFA
jgi:hypothetical protein